MNRPPAPDRSPFLYLAITLSIASLIWTTWSIVDLLGVGLIGLTVAASADAIWASVLLAERRGVRIPTSRTGRDAVPPFGWAAITIVAALLAWHGITLDAPVVAIAGALFPFGVKGVWKIALADMRDPSAPTPAEEEELAGMKREIRFEEAKHELEMRRREMDGEMLLSEVKVDYTVERSRQEFARELTRTRPFELLPANVIPGIPVSPPFAGEHLTPNGSETSTREDANTPAHAARNGEPFGFAATHATGTARDTVSLTKDTPVSPSRDSEFAPAEPANGENADPRDAAVADYLASLTTGQPLTGADLGRRYGRTPRWGQQLIAATKHR